MILYPLRLIDKVPAQGWTRPLPSSPARETSDLTGEIKVPDKTLRTELSQADLNLIRLGELPPGFSYPVPPWDWLGLSQVMIFMFSALFLKNRP